MMRKISLLFFIAITFLACHRKAAPNTQVVSAYFDMQTYFNNEAKRLQAQHAWVTKTVSKNGNSETKRLKITQWEREFKSFTEANINKAAWQNAFKVSTKNDTIFYSTTNDKIPVKKLVVARQNQTIIYIKAIIRHTNLLYTSTDTLSYYPGNYYEIHKTQKIKLMSQNSYKVLGRFK